MQIIIPDSIMQSKKIKTLNGSNLYKKIKKRKICEYEDALDDGTLNNCKLDV